MDAGPPSGTFRSPGAAPQQKQFSARAPEELPRPCRWRRSTRGAIPSPNRWSSLTRMDPFGWRTSKALDRTQEEQLGSASLLPDRHLRFDSATESRFTSLVPAGSPFLAEARLQSLLDESQPDPPSALTTGSPARTTSSPGDRAIYVSTRAVESGREAIADWSQRCQQTASRIEALRRHVLRAAVRSRQHNVREGRGSSGPSAGSAIGRPLASDSDDGEAERRRAWGRGPTRRLVGLPVEYDENSHLGRHRPPGFQKDEIGGPKAPLLA